MKVIDLTHTISEDMPVFPGDPAPVFKPASSYDADGFRETLLTLGTHTGTHVDAPAHLFADQTTLDQLPVEHFIGKALVIDCRDVQEGQPISLERVHAADEKVRQADFLLFNLGWDKYWKTPAYFGNYPCLDDEVLDFVLAGNYKGIGFDVMGLDPIEDDNLPRHKKLFRQHDIINIENLKNLDLCGNDLFWFSCFPLKIANADGSPVRAVAWFEESE